MIRGRIYALKSPETDKIYIGSTTRPLYNRWAEHKCDIKYLRAGNPRKAYKKTTATQITQYPTAYIELIEEYYCETRGELLEREREVIRRFPNCVNTNDPVTQSLLSSSSDSSSLSSTSSSSSGSLS